LDDKLLLSNDIKLALSFLPVKRRANNGFNTPDGIAVIDLWEENVDKNPAKVAVIYTDKDGEFQKTFGEVDAAANGVANWALSVGLKKGDSCCVFMENQIEFVECYLGLQKIGVAASLLNTNIRKQALRHCVGVSHTNKIIFGTTLAAELKEAMDLEPSDWETYCLDGPAPSWATGSVDSTPSPRISRAIRSPMTRNDAIAYIFTSGTTGMPKAGIINNQRLFNMIHVGPAGCKVQYNDIVYTAGLPLYHSAGGGLGLGMLIAAGTTVVIKRRFSASSLLPDVRKYNCTVMQYIGELCRYILASPKLPDDAKNPLRLAIGNGLRPEIWLEFQQRFGITEIGEFYGSTEGTAFSLNHCTTPEAAGACGRAGWLVRRVQGWKFLKYDVEKDELVRDANGFCIEAAVNEPGEMVAKIVEDKPETQFAGYTDKKATSKKVLTDVLEKGDKYFRSGDLLTLDSKGYIRFTDRLGDTFRWKGENVSTMEVSEVLSTVPGVLEANVYGVEVPHKDGRCPMVAIVLAEGVTDLNFAEMQRLMEEQLPVYARPLFVRVQQNMQITGTFKHQKVQLRKEGYDPANMGQTTDRIFWYNPDAKQFEPISPEAIRTLEAGTARL
jgi:fatty-acyl-CoA synthase